MDSSLRWFFYKHAQKIASMPPRRHLRFGLPFNVEDVTKQARLVYEINEGKKILFILHCFSTHKDYERWYSQFR
ncbi:hypothetical protein HY993_00140 [Candidatus Micrarchaeota archaeon]|nr:hypothetical protein [Candidatus Micrarchaeota archaeon]